jgi:hypothetical protein
MGKGSLLTLSIHAFVCGKQALAVRASGLASFLGQNAGRTSRHSQVSMNRTGRSRNSAGFSPLRTPHGSRCADRFGRINRNQFSMLRRTDWLIDLSAQSGVVILRNQQPGSGQPALEPKQVEARPFGSSLRPKRWHQDLRQWWPPQWRPHWCLRVHRREAMSEHRQAKQ